MTRPVLLVTGGSRGIGAATCIMAAGRGERRGQTSTSKCVPSRTPSIEPIMIVHTNMKRAISSVQM